MTVMGISGLTHRICKCGELYRWSLEDDAGREVAHGFKDSKRWAWWAAWGAEFDLMTAKDRRIEVDSLHAHPYAQSHQVAVRT